MKTIGIITAISLAALLFHTFQSTGANPCSLSGSLSGVVVRQPAITTSLSGWEFSISNSQTVQGTDGILLGTLEGTFSATDLGISSPVTGRWSYNQGTGNLLIAISGDTYRVDISILDLPSPGFTFSGILFVDGQEPYIIVNKSSSISC
ncbi:MAG: hypothetical protein HYY67_04430 [Thaumarchaeota archaeon]|nr:hypothetical protein [Nitrososphaerota archaeon]